MKYVGKIAQTTIFGQLEFINTENYTTKFSKHKNYINVSGKYKLISTGDKIDLTLEFFNLDLIKHKIN